MTIRFTNVLCLTTYIDTQKVNKLLPEYKFIKVHSKFKYLLIIDEFKSQMYYVQQSIQILER